MNDVCRKQCLHILGGGKTYQPLSHGKNGNVIENIRTQLKQRPGSESFRHVTVGFHLAGNHADSNGLSRKISLYMFYYLFF